MELTIVKTKFILKRGLQERVNIDSASELIIRMDLHLMKYERPIHHCKPFYLQLPLICLLFCILVKLPYHSLFAFSKRFKYIFSIIIIYWFILSSPSSVPPTIPTLIRLPFFLITALTKAFCDPTKGFKKVPLWTAQDSSPRNTCLAAPVTRMSR